MPALTVSACERLAMALAERARSAADAREFRVHALTAFRELIDSDRAVFVDYASQEPITTSDVDESDLRLIELCERSYARYAPEIGPAMSQAFRVGGVVDHEVFTQRQRHRSSFYAEIVHPQGLRSILMVLPRWRGRVLGTLRLERSGSRAFHVDQLTQALQLLPTVEVGLAALRLDGAWAPTSLPKLSHRECEIAMHVGRGLTTPQIALLLGTSKLTVRNQVGRIFDKLGIASRAELAAWVTRQQLVAKRS